MIGTDGDLAFVRRRQRVDEVGDRPFRFEVAERVSGAIDLGDVVRGAQRLAEKFDGAWEFRFFAVNPVERGGSDVEVVVLERDAAQFRKRGRRSDRPDRLNEKDAPFRVFLFFQRVAQRSESARIAHSAKRVASPNVAVERRVVKKLDFLAPIARLFLGFLRLFEEFRFLTRKIGAADANESAAFQSFLTRNPNAV